MHAALWKLYRLRIRGAVRGMVRQLNSTRGVVLAIFTLLVLASMIGPNLNASRQLDRAGVAGPSTRTLADVIPVVMLAYLLLSVVTSLGERAISFSPSEVDFLFPAPFSRRQLLLYKILGQVFGAIFIGLFMPMSLIVCIRSWLAAAVGFFLAFLLINALTLCAQLAAQSIGERAFTRARKFLLGGVIVAAAAALGQAAARGLEGPWQETLLRARHSLVAEIVLAPFAVVTRIIVAERLLPDTLGWISLGTVLVAGVYAIAIRLDANYLETAARISQQLQERRRRVLSDGMFATPTERLVHSSRLPQPPWWGGVGPVVWRQLIQAFRGGRRALVLVLIMVALMGAPLLVAPRGDHRLSMFLPHAVIGIMVYMTFLFSAQVPLGFRGDFDRMELLKSLPIRPLAMACGQTVVVAVLLTLVQCVIFGATAVIVPSAAGELLVAGLFALPCNWLLFGTDNLLFLLYPSPLVASGSEGFFMMGRTVLFMLVKFLVLGACGVVASIPAGIVYFLTGSIPPACVAAWLTLFLPISGILLIMAWALGRYDVGAAAAE
jgi:hypothetical protein